MPGSTKVCISRPFLPVQGEAERSFPAQIGRMRSPVLVRLT